MLADESNRKLRPVRSSGEIDPRAQVPRSRRFGSGMSPHKNAIPWRRFR